MAKLSILEGQLERNFSGVKLLRTDLANGGSCEWIPEDKVQLTTLNIHKNGTYKASDFEDNHGNKYYGFSQVTVSVTGRTTIVDPEDGNEYSVETDTETGELKKTILPSSIDVVGLPNKTMYRDGDPINKSGMIVKAYLADGTLYNYKNYQFGGIPLSELEIEPTKAVYNGIGEKTATSDLDTNWQQPIRLYDVLKQTSPVHSNIIAYPNVGCAMLVRYNTNRESYVVFVGKERGVVGYAGNDGMEEPCIANQSVTINGKTAYYISSSRSAFNFRYDEWEPDVPLGRPRPDKNTIWTAVYGKITGGEKTEVTVKWKRPEDNKELTDTFEITVIPANTSGGETQGSDTGGDGNTTGGGGGSW